MVRMARGGPRPRGVPSPCPSSLSFVCRLEGLVRAGGIQQHANCRPMLICTRATAHAVSGCSVQAGDTGTPPRKKSEHAGAWPRVSSGTWLVASIRFHVSLTVSRPLPSLSISGFVTEPSLPPRPGLQHVAPAPSSACQASGLSRARAAVGVERGPGSRLPREELRGRALLAPLPPPLTPARAGLPSAP